MQINSLLEKGAGAVNEDALLIDRARRRFGVFDGATSVVPYVDHNGNTGGYLAAFIAKTAFEHVSGTLANCADAANDTIAATMQWAGINTSDKANRWNTTIAAIEISEDGKTFDWVNISDSLILVLYRDGTYRMVVGDEYDQDREFFIQWHNLVLSDNPHKAKFWHDAALEHRRNTNVTYGALNGEPEAMNFVRSGRESLENVAHVLLFTDGLMLPSEDRSLPDNFSLMAQLFLEGGLPRWKEYVRFLEESDPQCTKYVRTKKSDDIGAIAISF